MPNRLDSVVIMNMHYSGLGIARALAGSGKRVIGLSFERSFFGNFSRFAEFRQYPNPQFDSAACLRFLEQLSNELGERTFLFPTRDIDIQFLMNNREALDRLYIIPYPDNSVLERIINKDQLYRVAVDNGIRCPEEVVVKNFRALRDILPKVKFPVIAKPVIAADWRTPAVWEQVGRQKVRRFDRPEELLKFYTGIEKLAPRISLQTYIDGPDSELRIVGAYRAPDGTFSHFNLRKLLQYPKEAGTGIVLETCEDDVLANKSKRLLIALGYHGIAEIEFKYDRSVNDHVLIEVNPRHWDQHFLGTMVGVNLTRVLIDNYSMSRTPGTEAHPESVKWIADDQYMLNLFRIVLHRTYSLRYYLGCSMGKKTCAVFSLSDPMPFLALIWFSGLGPLRRLAKSVGRVFSKRSGAS